MDDSERLLAEDILKIIEATVHPVPLEIRGGDRIYSVSERGDRLEIHIHRRTPRAGVQFHVRVKGPLAESVHEANEVVRVGPHAPFRRKGLEKIKAVVEKIAPKLKENYQNWKQNKDRIAELCAEIQGLVVDAKLDYEAQHTIQFKIPGGEFEVDKATGRVVEIKVATDMDLLEALTVLSYRKKQDDDEGEAQ